MVSPDKDPVRVTADHRIVFWDSGIVGQGQRRNVRCGDAANAALRAEAKRAELKLKVQSTCERQTTPHPDATVEDCYEAWIAVGLRNTVTGTRKKYSSVARNWLATVGGNKVSEMSLALLSHIYQQAVDPQDSDPEDSPAGQRSKPKALNTFDGIVTAASAWIEWASENGWVADSELLNTTKRRKLARKYRDILASKAANDSSSTIGTEWQDEKDEGITPALVPSWEVVEALGDALFRSESLPAPWHVASGRGSRGGRPKLSVDEAWRIGTTPPAAAATGLRQCELLGVHSSDVNKRNGEMNIRRQLDRYRPWIAGEPPPTEAPKHNKTRFTQCRGFYLPTLIKICDFADEHHGGWLYAPSAGQRWWADGWSKAVQRAVALMQWEHDQGREGAPLWTWRLHFLRHHFASWSLAPKSLGGYDLPLALVSDQMGHYSTDTTARIYQHRVGDDGELSRQVTQRRPGVKPAG